MVNLLVDILSWGFIIAGSFFVIVGAVGAVRFPDFWSRLHAASISDSGGVILLLVGMCLQAGPTLITVKLLVIGVFLFITGPTSTHAVANAALVSGLRPKVAKGLKMATSVPQLADEILASDKHAVKVAAKSAAKPKGATKAKLVAKAKAAVKAKAAAKAKVAAKAKAAALAKAVTKAKATTKAKTAAKPKARAAAKAKPKAKK